MEACLVFPGKPFTEKDSSPETRFPEKHSLFIAHLEYKYIQNSYIVKFNYSCGRNIRAYFNFQIEIYYQNEHHWSTI